MHPVDEALLTELDLLWELVTDLGQLGLVAASLEAEPAPLGALKFELRKVKVLLHSAAEELRQILPAGDAVGGGTIGSMQSAAGGMRQAVHSA